MGSKYDITCPYCFHHFMDTQVHFRMETVFDENNLNDEGLSARELERGMNNERTKYLREQTDKRKQFLSRDDKKYTDFWEKFKGTTESTRDKKFQCGIHQLPVFDPADATVQKFLIKQREGSGNPVEDYFIYDDDGMVNGIQDVFGCKTVRRVCPECHNPLPLHYGKNPTNFISVIGVTGAGKTIYLSQLLKYIVKYTAFANMAAYFTTDNEQNFILTNPVELDKPLPKPSMEGQISQPLFYDLQWATGSETSTTRTVVIYDVAGEDCMSADNMLTYGKFVLESDGIILLIDPSQLDLHTPGNEQMSHTASAEPTRVLTTIHNAFTKEANKKITIPIAVCVPKSDMFVQLVPDENGARNIIRSDISPVMEDNSDVCKGQFNAEQYNIVEPAIRKLINLELRTALANNYTNYNYFAFSATGCPVSYREEDKQYYLTAPPSPLRISEPLLWMFKQFGYISANSRIILPVPRAQHKIQVVRRKLFRNITEERDMTPEEKEALQYEE